MFNKIIFEDEITLYWDKEWNLPDDVVYRVFLDGKRVSETLKTHFSFNNLQAETVYEIQIERLDNNEQSEILFFDKLKTLTKKKRLDVTKAPYFAVGDGKTLNTEALQKALDDCKENEVVYFPDGVYMSGALDMHSDSELYLSKGAVLQGTANIGDYTPKRWSRFEGVEQECYSALINIGNLEHTLGYTTKNIVIRGGGTISGGGYQLCWNTIQAERIRLQNYLSTNQEYVKTCENENTLPGRARGRLVAVNNCQGVIFSNVTFQYGPAWNVHMIYSKDIVTYGCTIRSQGVWNGDGWNPDSSENCTIFNTTFATHDDAIAIKSGKNIEGERINRPTKNIRIFDCRGRNGVAIGSELSGGISYIYIWDCRFVDGVAGCRIKATRKRGGYVRNLKVRNCDLVDIKATTMYGCNDDGEAAKALTSIENLSYQNIRLTGLVTIPETEEKQYWSPIVLCGLDEEDYHVKNVSLKKVGIYNRRDGKPQMFEIKNVTNVSMEDLYFIEP